MGERREKRGHSIEGRGKKREGTLQGGQQEDRESFMEGTGEGER